uniref:Uncharacterized protein n=1 Tax=Arion vulgaris TaxID=1028688 RepID=A0A0B7B1K3_9EUPU
MGKLGAQTILSVYTLLVLRYLTKDGHRLSELERICLCPIRLMKHADIINPLRERGRVHDSSDSGESTTLNRLQEFQEGSGNTLAGDN